jgi:hypothetical protein
MDNNEDDEDPINRALNLGPLVPAERSNTISTIIAAAKNDSAKEDFTFARANIREVVENGNDAIAKLAIIADQSQNPRAFEVLAKLMDSMVSANKQLLELQKEIRTIDKADVPQDEDAKQHITNNNLFVGSTSELQKMIENMKKSNE